MTHPITLLFAGLTSFGCDGKNDSGQNPVGWQPPPDSGGKNRVSIQDAGPQTTEGDTSDPTEETAGCEPQKLYCRDNDSYKCIDGIKDQLMTDCGTLECNNNTGLCNHPANKPVICDTENQFQLSFHEETSDQWQHIGGYACEPLCPWDVGHENQPTLSRHSNRPGESVESIYFEVPICTNAKQVRMIFDAKLPARTGNVFLKLPFQSNPYLLRFEATDECNSRAFAVADLESNADLQSILRNGTLPITLEAPKYSFDNGTQPGFGFGKRTKLDETRSFNQCHDGYNWYFGLSRVTVVSCYDDIKTPDGRDLSSCELPSCHEVGAFRCFGSNLQECTAEGWISRETCSVEQQCSEETGKCLSPTEVCGETQTFLFNTETNNQFNTNAVLSCEPICPQYDIAGQPLLLADSSFFVSSTFHLTEEFQEPETVYLDITSSISIGGAQLIRLGDVEQPIIFNHSCVPQRAVFEIPHAEGGLLNLTIQPRGREGIRANADLGSGCRSISYASGVAQVSMTPCKTEYR